MELLILAIMIFVGWRVIKLIFKGIGKLFDKVDSWI